MLFHTYRVKENKKAIMARQLEKNQDDSVTKATKKSDQEGIYTVGCYRKVNI